MYIASIIISCLLSVLIQQFITSRKRHHIKLGVYYDLKELLVNLITVRFLVLRHTEDLDRAIGFHWSYASNFQSIIEKYKKYRPDYAHDEIVMNSFAAPAHINLRLKIYSLSYVDAVLNELSVFGERFHRRVGEIKSMVKSLNEEIDGIMLFQRQHAMDSLTSPIADTLEGSYVAINEQCGILIKKIEDFLQDEKVNLVTCASQRSQAGRSKGVGLMENKEYTVNLNTTIVYPHHLDSTLDIHIKCIQECSRLFKSYEIDYDHGDAGYVGRIDFPFEKLIEFYQRARFSSQDFDVSVHLTLPVELTHKDVPFTLADHLFEKFACDMFSVANFACPGVMNCMFVHDKDVYARDRPLRSEAFCFAQEDSPEVALFGVISCEKTFNWYKKVFSYKDVLPRTPAGKAIASLLRFCRYDGEDPVDSVLIIHAIEALFGGNIPVSLLKKRIAGALVRDDRIQKLENQLKEIYNWRHKLFHGALEIPHHLVSDFDKEFDSYIVPYMKTTSKALGIVLGGIQQLIKKNASGFEFKEKIGYTSL